MKTSREGWISGGASYTAVYVTPEVLSTQDTLRTTYLPICARVYLAFCLSVYLSVCLSVCSSVCFCLFLFVCLFLFLFVCLSVCLFVCLSFCFVLSEDVLSRERLIFGHILGDGGGYFMELAPPCNAL